MKKEENKVNKRQEETTRKALKLRRECSNDSVAAELFGLSKVTLYTRIKKRNWKLPEMFYIDYLYELNVEQKKELER